MSLKDVKKLETDPKKLEKEIRDRLRDLYGDEIGSPFKEIFESALPVMIDSIVESRRLANELVDALEVKK